MTNSPCTIQATHCENCGSTDPEDIRGQDGYTDCCNELLSYGPVGCRNHHSDR